MSNHLMYAKMAASAAAVDLRDARGSTAALDKLISITHAFRELDRAKHYLQKYYEEAHACYIHGVALVQGGISDRGVIEVCPRKDCDYMREVIQ